MDVFRYRSGEYLQDIWTHWTELDRSPYKLDRDLVSIPGHSMSILSKLQPSIGRPVASWAPQALIVITIDLWHHRAAGAAGVRYLHYSRPPADTENFSITPARPAALRCSRSMVMTKAACVAARTLSGAPTMIVSYSEYLYYVLIAIRDLCPVCSEPCPALSNVSRCPVNIRRICTWVF